MKTKEIILKNLCIFISMNLIIYEFSFHIKWKKLICFKKNPEKKMFYLMNIVI
jgi:hypothetical protein